MKNLHIITRIVGGGAVKNTLDTISGLAELGYDVHLMYGGDIAQPFLERMCLPSSVRLICIPELVKDINPLKDFAAYHKIYAEIAQRKYNVVHTHMAKAGVLGRMAAKKAQVPCIIHGVHGVVFPKTTSPIKRWMYRIIEMYCGKFTDCFIAVGEDVKGKFISAGVGKRENYCVIRSGIDYIKFDNAAKNSPAKIESLRNDIGIGLGDVIVGMVSRVEKSKGYNYLLEAAFSIVKQWENVKFVIVGDGNEVDKLKDRVRELGISKNVIFTGYRFDVADIISVFDIATFTSLREGLPQFLVQAALLGKPIVTFDVDGAREIVKEGENGFIVPMGNVKCLAERIRTLISNRELCLQMGSASQQMVDRTWTVKNMVKQTSDLYQKLLKTRMIVE